MQLQWLVLAVLAIVFAVDHFVIWRQFERRVRLDAARARHALWWQWPLMLWACAALVVGVWISQGLTPAAVGLAWPDGWRLAAPLVLIAAFGGLQVYSAIASAHLPGPKPKLRAQLGNLASINPHTASELGAWAGVSLTAGFCEELVFRGFLIWIFQPFVGWWIAALAVFTAVHAYQGRAGMVRVALIGAVLTLIVLLSRSLWPAIVAHAALDWMGGVIGWLILREPVAASREVAASPP